MGYESFELRRTAGALGAEIVGIDLATLVGDEVIADIRRALLDHQVIFFHDQHLTPEQHLAFGRRFGELNLHEFVGGMARSMKIRLSNKAETEVEHPVVRTHPETGRKALFVNGNFTIRFSGMTEEESAPLLDFLYRHATQPEFTCRFGCRANAIAFWDNRCLQHYAINDYHGQRRIMHRVTINGERPV